MAAVLQVAEYKRAHGLPIYDAARETAVLEKAAARIQSPALRPYYKDHVQNLMDVAKQYEAVIVASIVPGPHYWHQSEALVYLHRQHEHVPLLHVARHGDGRLA